MTEMIERVATAMMARFQFIAGPTLKADPVYWQEMAKFAIAAMRDPTPQMLAKADDLFDDKNYDRKDDLKYAYQTMIDCALGRS